jgi:hypothetical protein
LVTEFPEMGPALFDPDVNLEQRAKGLGEAEHEKAASANTLFERRAIGRGRGWVGSHRR